MKTLLKYFLLGLAGLVLRLNFPVLPVHFLALVAAYAYLRLGLKGTLPLLMLLSIFYSPFSLATAWQIFLPLMSGLLLFRMFQSGFQLESPWELSLLLFVLCAADFLFWLSLHRAFFPQDLQLMLGTMGLGLVGIPLLRIFLRRLAACFPRPHRPMESLPFYEAGFKQNVSRDFSRKPFGWGREV